jgi:hypothetical protein
MSFPFVALLSAMTDVTGTLRSVGACETWITMGQENFHPNLSLFINS